MMNKIEVLLDSRRGQFIPQNFAAIWGTAWVVDPTDLTTLIAGPADNENYWEAWERTLQNSECTIDGRKFTLHQEGDLFAVCFDELTDDEKSDFFGN